MMKKSALLCCTVLIATPSLSPESVFAQTDPAADLARQLANPIASLTSVPLQYNYDEHFGADDEGARSVLNIQPVIPIGLNEDWNLITRTIVPLVDADDVPPGSGESGLGDIVASQFFSPKDPGWRDWIWGAGPVELLPTASDDTLGGEQWGIGPTFVALRQLGPWTYGALANHLWSVAGDADRADVNATFLQPFVTYITKTKTTVALNTESTYDWETSQWSVPINFNVQQLVAPGGHPLQIGAGVRYWAESPETGPEDWGLRVQVTLLFPK